MKIIHNNVFHFQYIEMRFNSSRLQTFMMALIFLNANVFTGVCLYATSVTLAAVTPLSVSSFIYIMGVLCTLYSTIGGIRAVVWTDVFQLVVMSLGILVFIIAGIVKAGGLYNLFAISNEGQRLEFFNMNPSLYERHNFYNTLAFGAFLFGAAFSVSQINTQRICSVATLRDANLVIGNKYDWNGYHSNCYISWRFDCICSLRWL
ncbi:Sodium-dependent multivitamin transporter [Armadillidium vulgare]|nr:Sodium-dependent multivitamin transporter [Armadillidium vulgare]